MTRSPDRLKEPVRPRHLTNIAQKIEDLTDALFIVVAEARAQQEYLTWEEIGEAVGTSRQAAWERFTHARLRPQLPAIPPGQGVLL